MQIRFLSVHPTFSIDLRYFRITISFIHSWTELCMPYNSLNAFRLLLSWQDLLAEHNYCCCFQIFTGVEWIHAMQWRSRYYCYCWFLAFGCNFSRKFAFRCFVFALMWCSLLLLLVWPLSLLIVIVFNAALDACTTSAYFCRLKAMHLTVFDILMHISDLQRLSVCFNASSCIHAHTYRHTRSLFVCVDLIWRHLSVCAWVWSCRLCSNVNRKVCVACTCGI